MADGWRVIVDRDPIKLLGRLPRDLRERILRAIDELAQDPRPAGCKKLSGYENLYRIRVGEWRITYAVEDAQLIVLIIEIAPRGGAYRNL
jgi:mRNA interferase RelE/StbE